MVVAGPRAGGVRGPGKLAWGTPDMCGSGAPRNREIEFGTKSGFAEFGRIRPRISAGRREIATPVLQQNETNCSTKHKSRYFSFPEHFQAFKNGYGDFQKDCLPLVFSFCKFQRLKVKAS